MFSPEGYEWTSLDAFIQETDQQTPEVDSERFVSFSLSKLYPEWQERAHCKGVGYENYFGEDDTGTTMSIHQVRRATKLCDVCPVFVECLRHALENREEYGVWAGTSGRVRRRIFSLIDGGIETVDGVIERYLDGEGSYYRQESVARLWANANGAKPAANQGRDCLPPAASGEVAL